MKEQQQNIRDKRLYKYSSSKRYLKIHVPDFAFKHDDNNVGKDKFIGRELQIRKLFTWLTSNSKSGSYLITGYRGMGKSLLVKRVIDMISRESKAYKEVMFQLAMILTLAACFIGIVVGEWSLSAILGIISLVIVAILEVSKQINEILFEYNVRKVPLHHIFDKDMIAKVWLKNKDRRNRKYSNIAITVNLGQEVLNERDVLGLIAHSIQEKYEKYVHNRQNRPITSYVYIVASGLISFYATKYLILPLLNEVGNYLVFFFMPVKSWISAFIISMVRFLQKSFFLNEPIFLIVKLSFYLIFYNWTIKLAKIIRKKIPFFSTPYNSLERLNVLCERVASSLNEEKGTHPQSSGSFFNFSFGKAGKIKSTPTATVRELEQELMGIINDINGDDCPKSYQAQFIIIFDELDKIANVHKKGTLDSSDDEEGTSPTYETSVRGFTESMPYEQRKQNVLRLLANMKLFITSVKAKCVFISGYELFDASLADLSDREFAISSIFNGVLNVTSFLSPEREETDVSSMTEVYLATMLLPESVIVDKLNGNEVNNILFQLFRYIKKEINNTLSRVISFWPVIGPESYLKKRVKDNILTNGILKDELPSLRWYNQYLMEIHILNNEVSLGSEEIKEREQEIRHVMEFLRNFCVYLSHISNGSPKKIATYFEKYVRVNYDTIKQFDWYDEIEVGLPTEGEVRKQCVLYFDPDAQKLVNFVHYIAAPVMNAITNEVSHYGDKLLVSSSFILDQIYKYHGKGFSWRNLEQMPELLNTNKNPELRDSLASIMEFLLQTHITTISSSIFQYKFHKQIAEEISMLSKTSEEAAAIFNFTLNESETVKRYNMRLLWNYMALTNQTKDKNQKERYCGVLERLHENQGDIYFSEEDYYRAIHEYRSALHYIDEKDISAKNLIPYLKCSLKVGMSYEYRHTFENAYMVYCQVINKLIQLRWMEESDYGLDYTMRLTHDWRIKNTVLVDAGALKGWYSNECNKELRRHFKPGLYEDLKDFSSFNPHFSFDSDKTISSLSRNLTPEKSNMLLKLTAFEDIKFIYQAILAKLFVIEKMESSGVTQSSIDAAESEFITLYSTVNYGEKYILASDFFSKLASILYYKNGVVSAEKDENIYTTLYLFDIDILALVDDFCYYLKNKNDVSIGNAIDIKDNIRRFFTNLKTSDVTRAVPESLSLLYEGRENGTKKESGLEYTQQYLEYLDGKKIFNKGIKRWEDVIECYDRRVALKKYGCKLPCTACKYANRSIVLLMRQLFGHDEYSGFKVLQMLRYASHQKLFESRPEILSQLAASSEQLADIMLSCACTKTDIPNNVNAPSDKILPGTIDLISSLINPKTNERWNLIDAYEDKNKDSMSRLDLALLFYWSACRYYDIASMHQEAVHCIWRIASVIEKYLSVLYHIHVKKSDKTVIVKQEEKTGKDVNYNEVLKLLNSLFTEASRIVSRQYDNYNTVEIHELKWLLHFEQIDDIDLTKLTQFPNLQSIFISIINCNLTIYRLHKDNQNFVIEKENIDEYIIKMYTLITRNRHNRTFKSDVELDYLKVKLNYLIFDGILKVDDVRQYFNDTKGSGHSLPNMHRLFYKTIIKLFDDKEPTNIEKKLFAINHDVQSRLDLLDFLIDDTISCLSNIINTLPPHNQFSTFSNSFVADVYSKLWEWSKYYELMYNAYYYYKNFLTANTTVLDRMRRYTNDKGEVFSSLAKKMNEYGIVCKDNLGYKYTKLNANMRHNVDDATMHHIYINYSSEMAIKYYRAARGINSEGQEYKNLINTMYVLDDDLRNDTCQSNLADERYLLNSGLINNNRLVMQNIYKDSRTNKIESFENYDESLGDELYTQLNERYSDSLYTNTEY